MILISQKDWAKFCKALVPILNRLEQALRKWGPGYGDDVQRLARLATEDPQTFVTAVHEGFLWAGMGSIADGVNRSETMAALLDLADALNSIGLDTDRTRETASWLRQALTPRKK